MNRCDVVAGFTFISLIASSAFAETWEQQAERLQNVSAAMLDDIPLAEMPVGASNIQLKSNISFLPKTNPTIGAKSESVPSSPVHTVPTLQCDLAGDVLLDWTTGLRLWGGYLPAGTEGLVGLKATMTQRLYGVGWINRFKLGAIEPGFEIGIQKTAAEITGSMTASDAKDEFSVSTQIVYAAVGMRIPTWRTWINGLLATRRAESQFYIPADATNLHFIDTLDDGGASAAYQVAAGIDFSNGIQIGVGQLFVPRRLTMTRVLIGWKVLP